MFEQRKEFGEICREWYEYILKQKYDYVVFVSSRAYDLAVMMEKYTGKKMEENCKSVFLTGSSIILHLEEIVNKIRIVDNGKIESLSTERRKVFPKILFCDDFWYCSDKYRELWFFIKRELCRLLPEYKEFEIEGGIEHNFISCGCHGSDLVVDLGSANLVSVGKVTGMDANDAIVILYEEMLKEGITSNNYIFSESISKEEFEKINIQEFIFSRYCNQVEYTKIKYIGDGYSVKGIFTIRILKCIDRYIVSPYIFLPNLNDEETRNILDIILKQLRSKELSEWLIELYEVDGKRTFNELFSFILSNTLLQDFNDENNIVISKDRITDSVRKLARNYNQYGIEKTEELIYHIILNKFFTLEDISVAINEKIPPESALIKLNKSYKSIVSESEVKDMIVNMEKKFWNILYKEKKRIKEKGNYIVSSSVFFRFSKRLREIIGELCKCNINLLDYCIIYLLQMMDAQVISVAHTYFDCKISGYAIFFFAEEMVKFVFPLNDIGVGFKEILEKVMYIAYYYAIDYIALLEAVEKRDDCKIEKAKLKKLKMLITQLNEIGYEPDKYGFEWYMLHDEKSEKNGILNINNNAVRNPYSTLKSIYIATEEGEYMKNLLEEIRAKKY